MTTETLIALASGIVIPLAGIIIGGFWALNSKISKLCNAIGKLETKVEDREKLCKVIHKQVDERLEKLGT